LSGGKEETMVETLAGHFAKANQLGYVTKDMDRALLHFQRTMGIQEFTRREADSMVDLHGRTVPFRIELALANIGDRQIEIIRPLDGMTDFYFHPGIDLEGRVAALHHLGVTVEGPESNWEQMQQVVRAAGYDIVLQDQPEEDPPMRIRFLYADTRADFGHYLEFIWYDATAWAWNRSMPDQAR